MAYNQFSLDDVKQKLGLSVNEAEGTFADLPPARPSPWLEAKNENFRLVIPQCIAESSGSPAALPLGA